MYSGSLGHGCNRFQHTIGDPCWQLPQRSQELNGPQIHVAPEWPIQIWVSNVLAGHCVQVWGEGGDVLTLLLPHAFRPQSYQSSTLLQLTLESHGLERAWTVLINMKALVQ